MLSNINFSRLSATKRSILSHHAGKQKSVSHFPGSLTRTRLVWIRAPFAHAPCAPRRLSTFGNVSTHQHPLRPLPPFLPLAALAANQPPAPTMSSSPAAKRRKLGGAGPPGTESPGPAKPQPLPESELGPLRDGETRQAAGSKGNFYTIQRKGFYYQCSCPAFKNQARTPWACRTCKHIKALRGEAAGLHRTSIESSTIVHL